MDTRSSRSLLLLSFAAALVGCGPPEPPPPLELRFAAKSGTVEVRCGAQLEGLGTTQAGFEIEDLRFYVHDVRGVDAAGAEVPLPLVADGKWQGEDVALIDFEDKSGNCANGTTETRDRVIVADPGQALAGVRFRVGVPEALNHGDASVAESPLNLSAMFWGWKAGYKHLRLDGRLSPSGAGYNFHLGGNGCDGSPVTCSELGQFEVRLDTFDLASDVVVFDLAELLAGSDLETNAMDTPPGCQGSPASDADCAVLHERLGLAGDAGQQVFRRETAP